MTDIDNLEKYFEPIIEADKEPFTIVSKITFKENGKLRYETTEEFIDFREINSSIVDDIVEKSQKIVAKVYSKNFFERIFLKSKNNLNKTFSETSEFDFVYTSQKTCDNLLNLRIYILPIIDNSIPDNIIIKGNRQRLICFKNNKVNFNIESFRVIQLV